MIITIVCPWGWRSRVDDTVEVMFHEKVRTWRYPKSVNRHGGFERQGGHRTFELELGFRNGNCHRADRLLKYRDE
jgi:hypothetical protein